MRAQQDISTTKENTMLNDTYEAASFDELIFENAETMDLLEQYATGGRYGNVLLHGSCGTGKTSAAKVIAQSSLSNVESLVHEYNGAEFERANFKSIKNELNWHRLNGEQYGYTIINELDILTPQLQHEVRAVMDEFGGRAGFIFTTNNLHNIQPAIKSRCEVVEITQLSANAVLNRAKYILAQEKVVIADAKLLAAIATCNGDMREIIRTLENVVLQLRRKRKAA